MPHVIAEPTGAAKKVVVVGAGPAGLEAARVSARARAQGRAVRSRRQAGRADRCWRPSCSAGARSSASPTGWRRRSQRSASIAGSTPMPRPRDVLAEDPDIVVIATGGLPNAGRLQFGAELATSSWDVLRRPGRRSAPEVLLFDDHGGHEGLTLAEFVVNQGAKLEYVTPERVDRRRCRRAQLPGLLQGALRREGDDHPQSPAEGHPARRQQAGRDAFTTTTTSRRPSAASTR